MMDEFTYQGHWFLPGEGSDRVPGTLEFNPTEGLTLDLYRPFESYPINPDEDNWQEAIKTIFGTTTFGGEITLTECNPGGWRRTSSQGERFVDPSYTPEYCFIGEHIDGGPYFTNITVEISDLDKWIDYANVEDLRVDLGGTELSIQYPGRNNPANSPTLPLEGSYRLKFDFDNTTTIDEVISDYLWPFQQMVTLGFRDPVFPTRLYGGTESRNPHERNASGFRQHRSDNNFINIKTSVVFSEPLRRLLPESRRPRYYGLSTIEDNAKEVIRKWYDSYHEHRPLFDLYFNSIYYNDQPYPSVTLLNLTRALEAYHRKSDEFGGKYIESGSYENYQKELKDTIKEDFPEDFKAHLRGGTFEYANRLVLKRRLRDLIESHEDVLSQLIHEEFDSDEMASEIKRIRNDLTHLSDDDVSEFDREAEGTLLWKVVLLIEVIIADIVGLPYHIFPDYRRNSSPDE